MGGCATCGQIVVVKAAVKAGHLPISRKNRNPLSKSHFNGWKTALVKIAKAQVATLPPEIARPRPTNPCNGGVGGRHARAAQRSRAPRGRQRHDARGAWRGARAGAGHEAVAQLTRAGHGGASVSDDRRAAGLGALGAQPAEAPAAHGARPGTHQAAAAAGLHQQNAVARSARGGVSRARSARTAGRQGRARRGSTQRARLAQGALRCR